LKAQQVAETVVAGGAGAAGVSAMFSQLSPIFGLISAGLAIVLAAVLIYKGALDIKIKNRELARTHNQRKTDKK